VSTKHLKDFCSERILEPVKPKYRVQGISFPDEALYEAAVKEAKTRRRSLSNYICGLIEADLEEVARRNQVRYSSGREESFQPFVINEGGKTSSSQPQSTVLSAGVPSSMSPADAKASGAAADKAHLNETKELPHSPVVASPTVHKSEPSSASLKASKGKPTPPRRAPK